MIKFVFKIINQVTSSIRLLNKKFLKINLLLISNDSMRLLNLLSSEFFKFSINI